MEEIKFSDIRQELFASVTRQLSNYTVGFMRIEGTSSVEDAILLGSGTLVEVDGVYGILTAHHVMEVLPKKGELGLLLFSDLHRYTMNADFLGRIKIARGLAESEGPDLAVLVLPSVNLGQIKALKSFYNLSVRRDRILSDPPENDMGVWFLCGVPAEEARSQARQVAGGQPRAGGGGAQH